jgi:hypothetical protein
VFVVYDRLCSEKPAKDASSEVSHRCGKIIEAVALTAYTESMHNDKQLCVLSRANILAVRYDATSIRC